MVMLNKWLLCRYLELLPYEATSEMDKLEAKFLDYPGGMSLAKGTAIIVSAFFLKVPNQEPRDPPDWNF